MVMALIEAAFDKDPNVRTILESSLFELGKKQPDLVLSSCNSFLIKHSKVNFLSVIIIFISIVVHRSFFHANMG